MRIKNYITILIAAIFLIGAFAACQSSTTSGGDADTPVSGNADTQDAAYEGSADNGGEDADASDEAGAGSSGTGSTAQTDGFVLEYPADMQAQGYTEPLELDEVPQRIVSLTVAPVLALYEMGAHFVGVVNTVTVTWPDEIMEVSGLVSFNAMSADDFDYESVVNLNPDLVFVSAAGATAGQTLEDLGIPVYYINSGHTVDIESIEAMTQCLVDAFSADAESTAKGKEIMGRFDTMRENAARAAEVFGGRTVMVLQSGGDAHYIQSDQGTLGTMAKMIGFENVYSETMMAPLDYEQALDYNPDLVMCVGATDAETHRELMEQAFASNPDYWNAVPAIAEGRVLYLPSAYVSTAGINVVNNVNDLIETVADYYGVTVEVER